MATIRASPERCRNDRDQPVVYVVHLVPARGCVDPIRSVRAVLKYALRTARLRCTSIREHQNL